MSKSIFESLFETFIKIIRDSNLVPEIYGGKPNIDFTNNNVNCEIRKEETTNAYTTLFERAVSDYAKSDLGKKMNRYGRDHSNDYSKADKEFQELNNVLMQLCEMCSLAEDTLLFRGICVEKNKHLEHFEDGDLILNNDGYVSTSVNPLLPLIYICESLIDGENQEFNAYFLIIRKNKGIPCVPILDHGMKLCKHKPEYQLAIKTFCDCFYGAGSYDYNSLTEQEVLLPHQRFKIVDKQGDIFHHPIKINDSDDKNSKRKTRKLESVLKIFLVESV